MMYRDDDRVPNIGIVATIGIILVALLIAGGFLIPTILGERSKDTPDKETTTAETVAVSTEVESPTAMNVSAGMTEEETTLDVPTTAETKGEPVTDERVTDASTTEAVSTEEASTTDNNSTEETSMENQSYMDKVRANFTTEVPKEIQKNDTGKLEHIQYYSKKAEKQKGAYVWLPPEYSPEKKYPVFYINHGITGDETSMLNGFALREMASNLIQSGEAEPMILVFTFMYTNKDKGNCTAITAEETPFYDAFLDDLIDSLMPYIEANYPCLTGFENTAIGGFSMGGRESLYISITCPERFGYVAASSPAPGVVPAKDMFMEHPGCMREEEFKFAPDKAPYVLMLAGGTKDYVVGTFPEQYHKLFEKNATDHIWLSVPNGGHDGSVGIPLFYNFLKCLFKAEK